jgi:hypothetical protein
MAIACTDLIYSSESWKKTSYGRFPIMSFLDGFHSAILQVINHRYATLAFCKRLLVDTNLWQERWIFPSFATNHGPFDNVPSGVLLKLQDRHCSFDGLCGPKDIDGKAFKKHCESAVAFRPRDDS